MLFLCRFGGNRNTIGMADDIDDNSPDYPGKGAVGLVQDLYVLLKTSLIF